MSVTSGFFNSLNGDRKYNAEQMSELFNGIINDGVFANIGTAFAVSESSGNTVSVGIGRAWFNSTWVNNDAILLLEAEDAEILLNRYDAVVIEVDRSDTVRAGTIKIIKGTASSSPSYPDMESSTYVHQYPLAYLYRKAASSEITQDNITSMIGTSSCPYITGILEVLSIDSIVAQWQAQWNQWYTNQTAEGENQMSNWIAEQQAEFNAWFGNLQVILDGDVATKLAQQILELQERWNTLAKEYCVYMDIEDSDSELIEDSYGNTLEGKIVYKLA